MRTRGENWKPYKKDEKYWKYIGNWLDEKAWIISKFMTSSTEKKIITIHILPNIWRNNDIHIMRFAQLIEYNWKNIFLEISKTKCGAETNPSSFAKKSKLTISSDQQSAIYTVSFYCMSTSRSTKTYWD